MMSWWHCSNSTPVPGHCRRRLLLVRPVRGGAEVLRRRRRDGHLGVRRRHLHAAVVPSAADAAAEARPEADEERGPEFKTVK